MMEVSFLCFFQIVFEVERGSVLAELRSLSLLVESHWQFWQRMT